MAAFSKREERSERAGGQILSAVNTYRHASPYRLESAGQSCPRGVRIVIGVRTLSLQRVLRKAMEADVYDALTTKRVYKDAFSHEQAVQMIGEEAGRHFDPQLVDAFLACSGAFLTINRMGQPALALGSQEAWQSRALV